MIMDFLFRPGNDIANIDCSNLVYASMKFYDIHLHVYAVITLYINACVSGSQVNYFLSI